MATTPLSFRLSPALMRALLSSRLFSPACAAQPYPLASLFHPSAPPFLPNSLAFPSSLALPCRLISSQALRSSDSVSVAEEVGSLRKRETAQTSWDEAAQVFFSSPRENKIEDASGPQQTLSPDDEWRQSEEKPGLSRYGKASVPREDRNGREQARGTDSQSGGRRQWTKSYREEDRRVGGSSRWGGERGPKARDRNNAPRFERDSGSSRWGGERGPKARDRSSPRFGRDSSFENAARDRGLELKEDEEGQSSRRRHTNFERSSSSSSRREGRSEDEFYDRTPRREWTKEPSTNAPTVKGEAIYGVGPIYAALQVCRREFFCLYVQENMPMEGSSGKRKDKKALEWILKSAISRGVELKEVSKHDLNLLVDNRPHQGLVLDASPLDLVLVNDLEAPLHESAKAPVWVALDEVTDPQNFGAILRSAYFLGASGVVVCAKNSAPLSGVVSKASAGALEVMEVRSCRNMVKFLGRSIENGWRVVGAAAEGRAAVPVRELPLGLPTILVLGSEGRGLRTNVRRSCQHLVCVPGIASNRQSGLLTDESVHGDSDGEDGNEDEEEEEGMKDEVMEDNDSNNLKGEDFVAVESLNVSVAAGILLHELLGGIVPPQGPASSNVSSSDCLPIH